MGESRSNDEPKHVVFFSGRLGQRTIQIEYCEVDNARLFRHRIALPNVAIPVMHTSHDARVWIKETNKTFV